MPPHCDSLDGPVVTAARRALEAGWVDLVLPYVPEKGEADIRAVFANVLRIRDLSEEARVVGDRLFFETVVRIHRAGEGAPFTGLRPAGLSVGAVIPLAERAIETGSAEEMLAFLTGVLHDEVEQRLDRLRSLASAKDRSVPDARHYVEAALGFQVYGNHLLQAIQSPAHGRERVHSHPATEDDGE